MKKFPPLYEYQFNKELKKAKPKNFQIRPTVKIIIENEKGEIACIRNKMNTFTQLPGGGIEKGESYRKAARREAREEVGCLIKNLELSYYLEDYRYRNRKKYKNFCFTAYVKEDLGKLDLTSKELKQGMYMVWIKKEEFFTILEDQQKLVLEKGTSFYHTSFNMLRDAVFMKEYLSK